MPATGTVIATIRQAEPENKLVQELDACNVHDWMC